jgi:hypothetical protein
MGVQPPTNDMDDGPDVVEFGIAALDAHVGDLDISYPVTAEQLVADYGSLAVPVNASGSEITLAEAVQATDRDQFDSEQDLLNALHPVFEERRNAVSGSLLAQLRSLMPF